MEMDVRSLIPGSGRLFKPCAWAGLSGILTEIEWGFGLNDHLCSAPHSLVQITTFCAPSGISTSAVLFLVRER